MPPFNQFSNCLLNAGQSIKNLKVSLPPLPPPFPLFLSPLFSFPLLFPFLSLSPLLFIYNFIIKNHCEKQITILYYFPPPPLHFYLNIHSLFLFLNLFFLSFLLHVLHTKMSPYIPNHPRFPHPPKHPNNYTLLFSPLSKLPTSYKNPPTPPSQNIFDTFTPQLHHLSLYFQFTQDITGRLWLGEQQGISVSSLP